MEKVSIITLFKNPGDFFIKTKDKKIIQMPLVYFLFIGLIISYVLQKIDKLFELYILGSNIVFLLGLILLMTYIGFIIHNWFYKYRINKCGGKSDDIITQKFVLYSNTFLYFLVLMPYFLILLYLFFVVGIDNINDFYISLLDNIYVILHLIFGLHAIYISYNGVKSIYPDLDNGKTKFWFIYLPGFFISLGALLVLFLT